MYACMNERLTWWLCWLKPCIDKGQYVLCCPLPSGPLIFQPGGLLMPHVCFPRLATQDISEQDVHAWLCGCVCVCVCACVCAYVFRHCPA